MMNYSTVAAAASACRDFLDDIRDRPADQISAADRARVDELVAAARAARRAYDKGRDIQALELAGQSLIPVEEDGPAVSLAGVVAATRSGRVSGATAEYLQESAIRAGMPDTPQAFLGRDGVLVPWMSPRVRASTTAVFDPVDDSPAPFDPVFPGSALRDALGISPSMVSRGRQAYTWVREPSARSTAEGGAVVFDNVPADSVTLSPMRVESATTVSYELAATRPGVENRLLMALQAAVSDRIDNLIVNGDDSNSAEPNGLLAAIAAPAVPGSGDIGFQGALTAAGGLVDGVLASNPGDLGMIVSPQLNGVLEGAYVSSGSGETSAAGRLRSMLRAYAVSSHLPDAATSGGDSGRQGVSELVVRRGGRAGSVVMPVWSSVEIVGRQNPSGGGYQLAIVGLWNFATAPSGSGRDDFARLAWRVAANS